MKTNKKINITELYGKGMIALKAHWKQDLQAGFSVSLIALPLCLGIAIASGFPPMAGLISAIVGGVFVSRFNGSWVTIAGPAAGLIVVNLAAVEHLGLENALGAIFIAGLLIVLFGFLKAGKLGDFFPHSAVHGMLAAIGIIIIVKQFFVAIGMSAHGHEFYEIIVEIPVALLHANPDVAIISIISLGILMVHPKINLKIIKAIPAPIWVLAVAIPLEFILDFEHEHMVKFLGVEHKVGPRLLVHLPENIITMVLNGDFKNIFGSPSFTMISTWIFWTSVLTIALVTAIESMLSAIAVDSMDPLKRKSDLNKDLKALGSGTSLSSLMGGLPMISEIVRSSSNIANGAKTQWSNFFHGVFLTIFLFFGTFIINHIPLSALAAMLIFTGYRLASPKEFVHVYEIGKSEFLVFVTTLVMVLMTDLLIGIAIGIALNILLNLTKGLTVSTLFKVNISEEINESTTRITINGAVAFSNYLSLKGILQKNVNQKKIILNLEKTTFLDHSTVHHLHEIEREYISKGIVFEKINDTHLQKETPHSLSELRIREHRSVMLNERENSLNNLALENQWEYYQESLNISKWEKYPTFINNRVTREHNVLKLEINDYLCTVADIEVRAQNAISTLNTIEMTALHIDLKLGVIPSFSLEKEELFDKLVNKIVWKDIDFKSHPQFSNYYLLKGEDREAIEAFFHTGLLDYLQTNTGYHIESHKKGLLIYKKNKQLSLTEIKELIEFTKGFLNLWK